MIDTEQQANVRALRRMGQALDNFDMNPRTMHAKCYQVCAQVARRLVEELQHTSEGCAVIALSPALRELTAEPPASVEGVALLAALRTRRC